MSANIFAFIKSRVSIVEVIGQYITLKRAGIYWKGRCPFHQEKTASFTISPHIDIFYCFGCHQSGDVIAFISKMENCSQLEAAQQLAQQQGIELTVEHGSLEKKIAASHDYQTICSLFARWCHGQLIKNVSVIEYLIKRGFTKESLTAFEVGYMPGGQAMIKQLLFDFRKKSILPNDLVHAQLLTESKATLYSPFEDRVIFPIKDHLGHYCGFGGRTFKTNDTRPKYYNSRENDFFNKGSLLFGLDKAKKHIQESGQVFLVEGYTDCIAMVQHGYHNTVATLGTACTTAHLKLLSRYAHELIVIYDNDTAGNQAILRLTQQCWQSNLEPRVAVLPPGQDPASLLAQKESLAPYVASAQDIFAYFIQSLGNNFITLPLNQKLQVIKTLLETIALLNDPLKQDILLHKTAEQLGLTLDVLKQECLRIAKQNDKKEPEGTTQELSPPSADEEESSKLERSFFCVLTQNMQLLNKKEILVLIPYLPSTLRSLLLTLKEWYQTNQAGQPLDFAPFFDSLEPSQKQYMSTILLQHEAEVNEEMFEVLVQQLKKKWWKTIAKNIKNRVAQAKRTGDQVAVNALLQDFLHLQQTIGK